MTYSLNWNLDRIYPGGLNSTAFADKLTTLTDQIKQFNNDTNIYKAQTDRNFITLQELTTHAQTIEAGLRTAELFVNALAAADYTSPAYRPYQDRIAKLDADYQTPLNNFSKILAALSTTEFANFQATDIAHPVAFHLQELRQQAERLLDPATETLLNRYHLDGLKAWSDHYDTISAGLSLEFVDEANKTITLSAGQALNQIDGYPDHATRTAIMQAYEAMWSKAENLSADTLNHLAGARLTEQAAHNYPDHLTQPLELNRMSRATLDTMWQVVDQNKAMFNQFFARKQALLGLTKLGWQDQNAPITNLGDYQPSSITYDEAAEFIIKNFGQYSPKMATFAEMAFEQNWIEAEDRAGKTPGAWMESVPDIHESRIITTFTGSVNDAATIAHELGHAFHSSVLNDLPIWRDQPAMNLAETASTFAEMLIADANVQAAKSKAEKIALLDAKLSNAVAMFLNIRARFLFEDAFYQERQDGFIPAQRLNELMDAAQRTAFNNLLDERHPHFWTSKLHFYIDDVPFYNFPYTFGYLFSTGIYAWAQTQPNFEDAYIALLRDSANMTTEELAIKHLNVDLTEPDFWQKATDLIKADIDEFIELSAEYID